jgi:sodium/potassium-transporting ATPase subunit beta
MKANQVVCDFNTKLEEHQVCIQNISSWQSCYSKPTYGYAESQPCFLIKLNRIYDWKPIYYDDIKDLPNDMPSELVVHIRSLSPDQRKQVWVSCVGRSTGFVGEIEFVSEWRGFPEYFYPYQKQRNYLSPLVAFRVINPPLNTVVKLECRVWAKNIWYERSQKEPKGAQNIEFIINEAQNVF